MLDVTKKLDKKTRKFRKEVKQRMGLAIAAAFALVIGLSWNEFIKELVLKFVGWMGLTGTLWLKLTAAVLTTIICVIGIHYFSKMGK